jgi:uracil-DNA glycosylase
MPRLAATVRIVRAKHVILMGKVAEKACKKLCPDGLAVRHPSYLNRTGGVEGPEFRRWVCSLAELWEETCRPQWTEKSRRVVG